MHFFARVYLLKILDVNWPKRCILFFIGELRTPAGREWDDHNWPIVICLAPVHSATKASLVGYRLRLAGRLTRSTGVAGRSQRAASIEKNTSPNIYMRAIN
jgi:hypothetical protein